MTKLKLKVKERIAEKMAVPLILKLLKPYTATQMTEAINKNINLAKGLQEDPQYLNQLRLVVAPFPFADDIAKNVKKKKWIKWFVENAMKHKRRDLYNQIVYNPKGTKYIVRQVRRIVDLVFV